MQPHVLFICNNIFSTIQERRFAGLDASGMTVLHALIVAFFDQILAQTGDFFAGFFLAMRGPSETDDFHGARHHTQVADGNEIAYIIFETFTLARAAHLPTGLKHRDFFLHL